MTQPIPGFDQADLFAIQAEQLATDLAELEALGFIGGEDW